jgi:hypothetical protein
MPRLFDVSNVKTKTPIYQINASKAWNERNKDFMTEYWKKYADEHKAEISAKKKEYYKRKIEARALTVAV